MIIEDKELEDEEKIEERDAEKYREYKFCQECEVPKSDKF